jgi:hypothetical protein
VGQPVGNKHHPAGDDLGLALHDVSTQGTEI